MCLLPKLRNIVKEKKKNASFSRGTRSNLPSELFSPTFHTIFKQFFDCFRFLKLVICYPKKENCVPVRKKCVSRPHPPPLGI